MSVFEKPPGVGNSPAKSPHFPRFSSSVCTVSHIVSPHLSPLLPLSLCPSPSFLTSPTPPLCPFSVSYYPALLYLQCSAALTIRILHTHTHRHAPAHTHTQGDTRPRLPAVPLPFSHLSTADTKHTTTPSVPVFHQQTPFQLQYSAFTHKQAYGLSM